MNADWVDIATIVISVLALAVAVVNYLKYRSLTTEYNKLVETQTLVAQGTIELQIRSSISEAAKDVMAYAIQVESNADSEVVKKAYLSSEENYRNAYEDACAKYLDGKVDKTRFKKLYQKEIRQLVEEQPHCEFYKNLQTPYASTAKVYRLWFGQA